MDRDTVRLILLVIGIAVIAGIYIWGRSKDRIVSGRDDPRDTDAAEDIEPFSLNPAAEEAAEIEVESFSSSRTAAPRTAQQGEEAAAEQEDIYVASRRKGQITYPQTRPTWIPQENKPAASRADIPRLIQLSVIARADNGFSGEELVEALTDLGLKFGEMGIFHRYCNYRKDAAFSVASLVEPGTFPMDEISSFRCPGVVLFFAPSKVQDPLIAFDQLVHTCHELAVRLQGIEWDDARKPLTLQKIAGLRNALEDAY